MASLARVRLPAAEPGTAEPASRARTVSRGTSEDGDTLPSPQATAVMPAGRVVGSVAFGEVTSVMDTEDLRAVVARMEAMQAQQRSPQQPSPELDAEINRALTDHPEWRSRMAVFTKSAALRNKILGAMPQGARAVGSDMLGSTHPWRQSKVPDSFTDHNWPRAITSPGGLHHLPGGNATHDRLLRCPVEKLPMHPLLSHSACHSIPRSERFPFTAKNGSGELDKTQAQLRGCPGPGAYFKSEPRGPAFSVDGGETVILGANHVCPWKKALGHNINPVFCDATSLTSAPSYSFSKCRRAVSDPSLGAGPRDGGPAKNDYGCISPGLVYEHHGTMRPLTGTVNLPHTFGVRRKARSTSRVRMELVPPEASRGLDELGARGGEERMVVLLSQ